MADDLKKDGLGIEKAQPETEEAVALAYDPVDKRLPRVTAHGRGELAEELLRLALEHHIPIKYDPDLVQVLSKFDAGKDIPEDAYLVVAELLSFIYWVNQEYFLKPSKG